MSDEIIADIATLVANHKYLEIYVHEAEARCKERDLIAMKKINELQDEVIALEKKLTTSAIVWATICGTIATIFAAGIYIIDKALEWGKALQGAGK